MYCVTQSLLDQEDDYVYTNETKRFPAVDEDLPGHLMEGQGSLQGMQFW